MKQIWTLLILALMVPLATIGQNGSIKGRISSASGNNSLIGATVSIPALNLGTNTDSKGNYLLENVKAGTHNMVISFIGFADMEKEVTVSAGNTAEVNIKLESQDVLGEEVIISASKRPEKITQAPASVNVIRSQSIDELPSFNIGELAGRTKGVDYVRAGVLGTGLNVRGFNSAFNPKNLQVNDGRFSTLIATGLPLGSLSTIVKEDIERVEIILGPAAALYGPNAHNGLVNTITKDPRDYQGTTLAVGAGNQNVLTGRLRHAQVLIEDKLAFKITGEYTQGTEFDYVDSVYIGGNPFEELELNRDFNVLRGEAQIIYTPKENHDIIFMTGHSNSNNLAQTNAGRNQIKDWRIHYYQLKFQSPRWFGQVYYTQSRTDSTYAINQRTQNYWSYIGSGFSEEEALENSYSTAWFPLNADTPSIGIPLNRGAIFKDQSNRLNAEVQGNQTWGDFSIIGGAQFQRDMANSLGTYLIDGDGQININQIGVYAQAEYKIGNKLKLMGALRADNHDLYGFNFVPKGALLYFVPNGALRFTYSQGIAAPTILNLEANIFGGLLLGNGQGFTLSDNSTVDPLQVEKIQTIEVGYKGTVAKKLFVDANAYYNISTNFLSPAINVARPLDGVLVTDRGDTPIQNLIPGTPEAGAGLVLTYVNFGRVNTYGFDMGLRYVLNKNFDAILNYSFFGFDLDETDLENDGNRDGEVSPTDLPINAPSNKISAGVNYRNDVFFANAFVRWVQAYDFFSGINVAAATNEDLIYNGSPVVEDARVGRTFNYGPLGGFVNVDIAAGVKLAEGKYVISGQVTNLFNSEVREFVASPSIGRLFSVELKVNLGPIKPIK